MTTTKIETLEAELSANWEARRLEHIQRLLGQTPKLNRTSAPAFEYEQATRIALESLKRVEATKEPPRDRIALGGEFEPYTASENNWD
jgi:hypothetical protein